MIQHDPLRHIITNIGLVESGNPLDRALLTHCSTKVCELKDLYKVNQQERIDYNSADCQTAYMLYYFPNYIETIYHSLIPIEMSAINGSFRENMKICIMGGGPAPELYGFLAYLKERFPKIMNVEGHFFDKNNWENWRQFCFDNFIEEYWGCDKSINYWPYFCDLCKLHESHEIENFPIIKEADLLIIQNCGLDIYTSYHDINKYRLVFNNLIQAMKTNSIIAITDVVVYNVIKGNWFETRGNLHHIRDMAQSKLNCTVLRDVSSGRPYSFKPNVIEHSIIRDNFPKKGDVKYHALVMKKNN